MPLTPSPDPAPDLSGLCLAITEHAPLPMATVEGTTHIVRYVNPAFARMMDKPVELLLGKQLSDLLPEKDACIRLLDRVFRQGKPESFTEREDSPHNPIFWSYTMWPVLADQALVGIMIQVTETAELHGLTVAMNEALVLGSVRQHELTEAAEKLNDQLRSEIAERRQAQEAKSASDERFRTLFELGPVAVYSCDAAGVIQDFNRRAAELWGRAPAVGDANEQFCGSFKMFRPDGSFLPHEECPMAEVVAGKMTGAYDAEVLIERPDGTAVTVVVNIRPLKNARGEITGAINCFYDISERKRFEQEREAMLKTEQALLIESQAANSAKDTFLATLSHEMRTPLNAILGWASVIRSSDCTPEEIREGILVIERNVHAQAQLINDVLDVSRVASGKLQLELAPSELVTLINDAIDVVRPAANAKAITIRADLDPAASHLSCDPHRMRQVIWNILTNSVKFTPNAGAITITLTRDETFTNIRISDNGTGIAPDLLPFIFERFRQGEGGSKRQFGGLGIGLSLVKNLVELHGGNVSAHSDGANRGTRFTIQLPVRTPPSPPHLDAASPASPSTLPPATRAGSPSLSALRILVVDDDADARTLLAKVLRNVGALVTTAGSAAEALHLLDSVHPDILLSDIAMPVQDGYDLIRQVRKGGRLAKDLPAIAITAFAHKDNVRQALLAGFQMHVAKPIDPFDLIAIVAAMTGRTHAASPA